MCHLRAKRPQGVDNQTNGHGRNKSQWLVLCWKSAWRPRGQLRATVETGAVRSNCGACCVRAAGRQKEARGKFEMATTTEPASVFLSRDGLFEFLLLLLLAHIHITSQHHQCDNRHYIQKQLQNQQITSRLVMPVRALDFSSIHCRSCLH